MYHMHPWTRELTVLFTCSCVITGFTAWSSTREPCQVFTLLETVYHAFDEIARRRGVFKVETIGDSYVAVCGVPTAKADHALVMARFARDCRTRLYVYSINMFASRLYIDNPAIQSYIRW